MKRCLCGCGRPVSPGKRRGKKKRYASGACFLNTLPKAARRSYGREGGFARRVMFQRTLIESLANLDRDAAILEAYRRGRRAMYHTRDWARAKRKAAA